MAYINRDRSKPGRELVIAKPIDSVGMELSDHIKNIRIATDGKGNIWAQPVIVVDPSKERMVKLGVPIPSSVFKRAEIILAGDNTLWTPTAGHSIRLQGISAFIPANTTFNTNGNLVITFSGGDFVYRLAPYCTNAATTDRHFELTFDPPLNCFDHNEILIVQLTLPGAKTGAPIFVDAWGYEE